MKLQFILQYVVRDGDQSYWNLGKIDIESFQIQILKKEIELYNEQIKKLENGTAPPCCYKDPDDMINFFYAKHRDYDKKVNRQYYQSLGISFELYAITDIDYDEVEEDKDGNKLYEIFEEDINEISFSSMKDLENIIMNPLDLYDTFSLGYAIFPMTDKLVSNNNL